MQCKESQDLCFINAIKADTEVPVIFVYDYCYSTGVKCTCSWQTNLVHQATYPTPADTFTITSPERTRTVKVHHFSQNKYHGSFKYSPLLLSSSSESSSVSECTVCQVRPSPVGLCGDGNKTCLHVLPLTIPRKSRQFFLRPKSYGFM